MPAEYAFDLSKFLKPHPSLSWVHSFQIGDYASATQTLNNLGTQESRWLGRKKVRHHFPICGHCNRNNIQTKRENLIFLLKTLLSLGKLSALAAEPEQAQRKGLNVDKCVEVTNQQLYLIEVQIKYRLKPTPSNHQGIYFINPLDSASTANR